MHWKPAFLIVLFVRVFLLCTASHTTRTRRSTGRTRLGPLQKRAPAGGLPQTTSRAALLDAEGNPTTSSSPDEGDSRAGSMWSRWRGGGRSDASRVPSQAGSQQSQSQTPPRGAGSSGSRYSRTTQAMQGNSPRSSFSNEPWNQFQPTRLERHDELEHGSSAALSAEGKSVPSPPPMPPPQATTDRPSGKNTVKSIGMSILSGDRWRKKAPQEEHKLPADIPPDFHLDKQKLRHQMRPQLERQAKEGAAARDMSHEEKERAVRHQYPDGTRSLHYLLTAGYGHPLLQKERLRPGVGHVVLLTRDQSVRVPHSKEDRTHVLVAGPLAGTSLHGHPLDWAATAFSSKPVAGVGYKHKVEPFRPEAFSLALFKPKYMGRGVQGNTDYHKASVETDKAGDDHDILHGQEKYVNSMLHFFQPWRATNFFSHLE